MVNLEGKTLDHPYMILILQLVNIKYIQGDKIVQGTFKTTSCVRDYVPGRRETHRVTLYSCALSDAPEYYTNPRMIINQETNYCEESKLTRYRR
jgi:hypothetical protein